MKRPTVPNPPVNVAVGFLAKVQTLYGHGPGRVPLQLQSALCQTSWGLLYIYLPLLHNDFSLSLFGKLVVKLLSAPPTQSWANSGGTQDSRSDWTCQLVMLLLGMLLQRRQPQNVDQSLMNLLPCTLHSLGCSTI